MYDLNNRSLLASIVIYRFPTRLVLLTLSFAASFSGLLSPFFQKAFIDILTGQPAMHLLGVNLSSSALVNIFFSFVAILVAQGLSLSATYYGAREAFFIQKNLGDFLYKKMLSLRRDTMNDKPIGEVVSIYATDIASATTLLEQTLPMGAAILFPMVMAPVFIHALYDIPLTPILLTMSILLIFHFALSVRQSKFFFRFKQLAAERSGLVNEWIQNIRSLRILAWTRSFEAKIFAKRNEETTNRINMVTNGQVNSSVASSVSFFINLSGMFSVVYLSHKPVTPGEILTLLWIFGVFLTRPLRTLPWVFTFAFDSYSSIKRLENFMKLGDESENSPRSQVFEDPRLRTTKGPTDLQVRGLNLEFQNQKILDNINLDVCAGEFIAIVGEVGSGKSLLLFSLIREVSSQFSKYSIGGEDILVQDPTFAKDYFTFVSQDGFVMSSNLRENVAFEYDFTHDQDEKILTALKNAVFEPTKEALSDGLETEIGERGVNLSGGQKQRVSLARAAFFDRPIILLDDCLSAVDVDTEKELLSRLIMGAWKHRTRILVTHRLSVLEHVDRIIFLENGRIKDMGTYAELKARSASFKSFTAIQKDQNLNLQVELSEYAAHHPELIDVHRGDK